MNVDQFFWTTMA